MYSLISIAKFAWIGGLLVWAFVGYRNRIFLKSSWPVAFLVSAALAVFFGWHWWSFEGALMVINRWGTNAPTWLQSAGLAGDLFGGFNALFASLAFVAAMAALAFQAGAMRAAQRQLALQAFEPLFLHLMDIHGRVAPAVQMSMDFLDHESGRLLSRRVSLDVAAAEIGRELPTYRWFVELRLNDQLSDQRKQRLGAYYARLYIDEGNEHGLGPYFRSLYHIFKFIHNADLSEKQKVSYANIARSTLGKGHLLLLALNCLTKHGEGFKPLVEEYGLLKHIAEHEPEGNESGLEWLIVKWCYSPTARLSAEERKKYWRANPGERPVIEVA